MNKQSTLRIVMGAACLLIANIAIADPLRVSLRNDAIATLDTSTGIVSDIVDVGRWFNDIAYADDGTLYGVSLNGLYTIDLDAQFVSGRTTLVDFLPSFLNSLTISDSGTFYGTGAFDFYEIGLNGGNASTIQNLELYRNRNTFAEPTGAIAVDNSGTIYTGYDLGIPDYLGIIDRNTVGTQNVNNLGFGELGPHPTLLGGYYRNMAAMDIVGDTLYGIIGPEISSSPREYHNEVFEIDLATGNVIPSTATLISGLDLDDSILGAAAIPGFLLNSGPETLTWNGGDGDLLDAANWDSLNANFSGPAEGDILEWRALHEVPESIATITFDEPGVETELFWKLNIANQSSIFPTEPGDNIFFNHVNGTLRTQEVTLGHYPSASLLVGVGLERSVIYNMGQGGGSPILSLEDGPGGGLGAELVVAGPGSTARFNLFNGQVTGDIAGISIAHDDATGFFRQTGGTVNVSSILVGAGDNAHGEYLLEGGVLSVDYMYVGGSGQNGAVNKSGVLRGSGGRIEFDPDGSEPPGGLTVRADGEFWLEGDFSIDPFTPHAERRSITVGRSSDASVEGANPVIYDQTSGAVNLDQAQVSNGGLWEKRGTGTLTTSRFYISGPDAVFEQHAGVVRNIGAPDASVLFLGIGDPVGDDSGTYRLFDGLLDVNDARIRRGSLDVHGGELRSLGTSTIASIIRVEGPGALTQLGGHVSANRIFNSGLVSSFGGTFELVSETAGDAPSPEAQFINEGGVNLSGTSFGLDGDYRQDAGTTVFNASTSLITGNYQQFDGVTEVNSVLIVHDGVDVSGGILSGVGNIIGEVNVHDGGILGPGNSPGTLFIDGDLNLFEGSTLVMEFGGTEIDEYDRLIVSGELNLEGEVIFELINGTPLELLESRSFGDFFLFGDEEESAVPFDGSLFAGVNLLVDTGSGPLANFAFSDPAPVPLPAAHGLFLLALGFLYRMRVRGKTQTC